MKMKLLAAVALAAASFAGSASAEIVKFSAAGQINPIAPNNVINCSAGTSYCYSSLSYTTGSVGTITATPSAGGSLVIQDLFFVNGGLGVMIDQNDAIDEINRGQAITLTFSIPVTITAAAFGTADHFSVFSGTTTGSINGSSFFLSSTASALNVSGTSFTFAYGGTAPADFYISSLDVRPIPEPSTYALLAAGLGMIGFMARRRRSA